MYPPMARHQTVRCSTSYASPVEVIESPKVGSRVRVRATGVVGLVVEVFRRQQSADVDLGDGITAELAWEELEAVPDESSS